MAHSLSYFNDCINNFANDLLALQNAFRLKLLRHIASEVVGQISISWNLIDCRCLAGGEARGFTSTWTCGLRKLVRGCSSALLFKISIS